MAGDDTDREIARLLRAQSGVISRDQVIAAGGRPSRIVRMLAHQDWARIMDGVFVEHTGRPTWRQRAWAGVLRYQPAALGGHSALRAAVPDWRHHRDARPITLVVARGRHLTPAAGYRFRRVSDLDERVQWHTSPPRQRVEHSIIDLASVAITEFGAISLLADACQSGAITPERTAEVLRAAAGSHARDGCSRSSTTWRWGPPRSSSMATSPASSDRTACPPPSGSDPTWDQTGRSGGTRTTTLTH